MKVLPLRMEAEVVARPDEARDAPRSSASHGDDDFSLGVTFFQIADGLGDLTQLVVSVDDRRDFSGFKKFFQDEQVLFVSFRQHRDHLLAHERRQHEHLEDTSQRSKPSAAFPPSDVDVCPVGSQHAPAL